MKYLLPILLLLPLVAYSLADDPKTVEPKPDAAAPDAPAGAPTRTKSKVPGFVHVPSGTLHPGCSKENYESRANDAVTKAIFAYEVWSKKVPPVSISAFNIGKYEVTNAQWKLYLDRNFRVKVVTSGQDTLQSLAKKHIKFQDDPIEDQWKAIYSLNWKQISDSLKSNKDKKAGVPLWKPDWRLEKPLAPIREVFLPKGLELEFYSTVVPSHWYGWTKLAGLSTGKEYVEVRAAPADAFAPPQDEMFATFRLRSKDFKNFPVRDLAPLEALRFAEWAGCSLPSEFEFERAARGGKPNSRQHPGAGPWNHGKQPKRFAFADNKACNYGPLAVDDETVSSGDTDFGARHMLGNVWELTRTFWDLHPYLKPKPNPEASGGLFNYAVMAKGGAWGSGYRQIQISTRTGKVGGAELDLKVINRADSLGLRLVRHDQPCYDLLIHTRRHLAYGARLSSWSRVPHEYSLPRITGVDATHFVDASAADGYTFVQDKAVGIGVLPVWAAKLKGAPIKTAKELTKSKNSPDEFTYLGVIRIDVPFKAGKALNAKAITKLKADRKKYKELKRKADAQAANKKKGRGKKKGKQDAPIVLPPKPVEPDAYEIETKKHKTVWREAEFPAGNYHIVYWYGYLGLVGQSMGMPPQAIFLSDKPESLRKIGNAKGSTTLDVAKNQVHISFVVEEKSDSQKAAPKAVDSDLWAISEVLPEGWPGRVKPKKMANLKGWKFNLTIPTTDGALKRHKWNAEPK